MKKKPAKTAHVKPGRIRVSEPDVNQLAHHLIRQTTERAENDEEQPSKSEISRVMAELGRRGGKIGGKRRAENMTKEERRRAGALAARARWGKRQS